MAVIATENATHRANLLAAEMARQISAGVPGLTQAQIKEIDITYFRAALASAIANSCGTAQFTTALVELGTGGT